MCRIVTFLNSEGGLGQTSLIYTLGKFLSKKRYKVCVIDCSFNFNSLSLKFNVDNANDFKDVVVGGLGFDNVLNNVNDGLWFVKTNSVFFDYTKHLDILRRMIDVVSDRMDFILIDLKSDNLNAVSCLISCSNEVMVVMRDTKESLLNSFRILQKVNLYKNVSNVKLIVSRANIIKQAKGLAFTEDEIEKTLKYEVLFVIPEFVKYNYFNKQRNFGNNEKIIKLFCCSFLSNKNHVIKHRKVYQGIIGWVRRKFHEKYE